MTLRQSAKQALLHRLSYEFKDADLFERALTHASASETSRKVKDNERLEFLGDRVLGLMISEALMGAFPEANEGELSKRFHALVSRQRCAEVAETLNLAPALKLTAVTGGRQNKTLAGNALEALLGAVFLDGGFETAKRVFLPFWQASLLSNDNIAHDNPKSFLQEWAAAHSKSLPRYELLARTGPDHAPHFKIAVHIDGTAPAEGEGRTRQEAEKSAAKALMARERLI